VHPGSEPVHVPLLVAYDAVVNQRNTLREILGWSGISTRTSEATRLFGRKERFTTKSSDECFKDLLNWLWINIVETIYQSLESVSVICLLAAQLAEMYMLT
jgi:hypothetical protein